MRFFRLHWWTDEGGSGRYTWYRSEPEARQAMREGAPATCGRQDTLEVVEIELTDDGILAALNRYASPPDNG